MNDLNTFFDTATPAQINGLTASAPKQTRQVEPAAQVHPNIQAPTLDELPEAPMESVEAQPDIPVQSEEPVHEQRQESIPPIPQESQESPQQLRFREVREQKLRAEWERDELARRLQAYESSERQRTAPQQQVEEEDLGIAPDDVIEGKHIAKIIKQVEQRTERKFKAQQESMMQVMVENRLKMELPDLDAVVNTDSVARLRSQYPELAQSINANNDLYSKAKAAYTMIKQLNLDGNGYAKPQVSAAEKQRIATNSAKPRSIQSAGVRQSPLASSGAYDGELTDELKVQLRKEMEMARRR